MDDVIELRAADGASAEIHLRGAHVARWFAAGREDNALFLSRTTQFAPGVAIRGGVPVIFPQFAAEGPLPKHGFARVAAWSLLRQQQDADGGATAVFQLKDSEATRGRWPHAFLAELVVTVRGEALTLALMIENTGKDTFEFTAALHTYLQVADIAQVQLRGLQHLRYRDSANGGTGHRESQANVHIEGEVDRIYFDAPHSLQLIELARVTEIHQSGFTDTVVWNPGAEKAAALTDLEPQGWRRMLCVEAAVIDRPVVLGAGQQWHGTQTLIAR